MFERDYILRAIKQFMQALARILQKKESQQYDQALEEIDDACRHLSGMASAALALFDAAAILDLCRSQGDVEVPKAAAIARLLKERGEVLALSGEETEAKRYYIKSFLIYDTLTQRQNVEEDLADHQKTIHWLMDQLE